MSATCGAFPPRAPLKALTSLTNFTVARFASCAGALNGRRKGRAGAYAGCGGVRARRGTDRTAADGASQPARGPPGAGTPAHCRAGFRLSLGQPGLPPALFAPAQGGCDEILHAARLPAEPEDARIQSIQTLLATRPRRIKFSAAAQRTLEEFETSNKSRPQRRARFATATSSA